MRGRHLTAELSKAQSPNRQKLVEIDQKYALMTQGSRQQVTNQLEDELDYLLGRKEREALKRKKLQELETQYEQQRNSRLGKIQHKISRSQQNRQHELSSRRAKSKKELDHFNTIRKKVEHENEEQLEKMLEAQKTLANRRTDSRSSRTSVIKQSSRISKSHLRRAESGLTESVELRMSRFEDRMNNASSNSKLHFEEVAEKARSYSRNFEDIVNKIRTKSVMQESKCIGDYFQRATHIEDAGQRSKSFFHKESERKKKKIEEKFKIAKRNLRIIDRELEAKHKDIQAKLDRTFAPKSWRNNKNEVYLQKFTKNQKDLQEHKANKAEQILKRHLDLSMRNKALREKKQKIHQTLKKIDS